MEVGERNQLHIEPYSSVKRRGSHVTATFGNLSEGDLDKQVDLSS